MIVLTDEVRNEIATGLMEASTLIAKNRKKKCLELLDKCGELLYPYGSFPNCERPIIYTMRCYISKYYALIKNNTKISQHDLDIFSGRFKKYSEMVSGKEIF